MSNALKFSFNLYEDEELGKKKLSTDLARLETVDWKNEEDMLMVLREYFGFTNFREG